MIGLLRSEFLRIVSRRFLRLLAVVILALLLVQAVVAFFESSKDPNAGMDDARAQVAECERFRQEEIDRGGPGFQCETLDEVRQYYDRRFNYAETMRDVFTGIGIMFLAVGLVVGASFIGAEYGSGSMTTLLTWEPRRLRVMAAKWIVAALSAISFFIILLLLICAIFYPIGILRGTTDGATRSFWWTQMGLAVRDLGLGVFGVSAGVALATLFRSTAGAVGFGFFYGAIGDFLLSIWRGGVLKDWLLRENIARLLSLNIFDDGDALAALEPQSAVRPAITLTIYALGLLAVATAVFRRRDVT